MRTGRGSCSAAARPAAGSRLTPPEPNLNRSARLASDFRWTHRVEFGETDMAGIVHFTNYFRYMEMAEHAFLRSIGLSVHADRDGTVVSWPRLRAECSFKAPLTFDDEVEVHLAVREKTHRTITYDFRLVGSANRLVATGSTTTICVSIEGDKRRMSAIPIPEWIHERIEVAPAAAPIQGPDESAGSGTIRSNQTA